TGTITLRDKNGVVVATHTITSLTGTILYPGAVLDSGGNIIDWPGWKFEGGLWVVDPSDAHLREGLTMVVDINPTSDPVAVTYPPASAVCADPDQPQADLAIVKNASVTTAERGTSFNWVLDVVNNGPQPATNAVVSDTVPAPLVVTGVSSAQFSCSNAGNVVTCTKASMAVGETGQITVAVSVPADAAAGNITNVGSVQAVTPDPNLTNNSDDASVTVPPVAVQPPVQLPRTGADATMTMVRLAGLLIGAGAVVLFLSRRRRLHGTP
ncbi:MAG TPA: LPXTG cell wall anchor domain-containing protein, partial [Ilumatobacteraceae bacterium]